MIREKPGVSRRVITLTAIGVILGGVTGLLASAERAAFTDSSSGAVSVASFHPNGTTFLGGLFASQSACLIRRTRRKLDRRSQRSV